MDTSAYKQLLLKQRQTLLEQLVQQRGGSAGRVEAALAQHQTEEAHDHPFEEREMELILDERESTELDQIAAALKRIEDNAYGACIACGTDIPEARLRAAPEAARCIACQTRFEQTHGGQV